MTDARHLGLVTGGADSERSDTYGLNMAPSGEAHAEAIQEYREREFAALDEVAPEVARLRAEFNAEPWNAERRMDIRKRLAQLSHTVHPDRHETQEEYEIDRLRVRARETVMGAEHDRIVAKLANLGTVIDPVGSPRYVEYTRRLRAALAEPDAFNFLD